MAGSHRPGDLDDLDAEQPGTPFVARIAGRSVRFRPAVGVRWKDLLIALDHWPAFVDTFGPRKPRDVALVERLPVWQMQALVRAWRLHHGLCDNDRDHWRLIGMMGKRDYRAAIERDLHQVHHGLELASEWQSRRWRRLLNLIDGLGRTSHLHEVMTQDDELADAQLEREARTGEESKPRRLMREFSVEAELLSHAVDRLGELIQTVGATKGAKRRPVTPMPRPEMAIQRARERRAQRKHRYTVARVFGYIDDKGRPTGRGPGGTPPSS